MLSCICIVCVCVFVRPVSWVGGLSSDQVSRYARNVNCCLIDREYWSFVHLCKLNFAMLWCSLFILLNAFLHTTVATVVACLSHRNSFYPSIRLSLHHTGGSVKTMQARITKFSPSAAWKTLVLGSVKLFHKFERDHPQLYEKGVGKICNFLPIRHWLSETGRTFW